MTVVDQIREDVGGCGFGLRDHVRAQNVAERHAPARVFLFERLGVTGRILAVVEELSDLTSFGLRNPHAARVVEEAGVAGVDRVAIVIGVHSCQAVTQVPHVAHGCAVRCLSQGRAIGVVNVGRGRRRVGEAVGVYVDAFRRQLVAAVVGVSRHVGLGCRARVKRVRQRPTVASQVIGEVVGVVVVVDDAVGHGRALVPRLLDKPAKVVVCPIDLGRAERVGRDAVEALLDHVIALAVGLQRVRLLEQLEVSYIGRRELFEPVEVAVVIILNVAVGQFDVIEIAGEVVIIVSGRQRVAGDDLASGVEAAPLRGRSRGCQAVDLGAAYALQSAERVVPVKRIGRGAGLRRATPCFGQSGRAPSCGFLVRSLQARHFNASSLHALIVCRSHLASCSLAASTSSRSIKLRRRRARASCSTCHSARSSSPSCARISIK